MIKILLGIIATLVIALGVSAWFLKHEVSKLGSLQADYNTSQGYVKQLNKELEKKVEIDKTTDAVVEKVDKQKSDVETKISTIQRTVQSTSKREAKGEITPAAASSIYIDSMWRAYCEAGITDPHCPSK